VVFRGIPYAAAPVGERRFKAPEPPRSWDGERPCLDFGPSCPQLTVSGSGLADALNVSGPLDEDCLFLNVWTPAADGARRPTMVWLHGGAFTAGSGAIPLYDGGAFSRDDVVLVTVNYRLHAFGFLRLADLVPGSDATGNLGILDQIAALEWVRDNIAALGGDPDNVTVFGESAGGMSVGTLLGMPAARGLFRRAIAQSGAAHCQLEPGVAERVARRFLELARIALGDLESLQRLPATRVVEIAARVSHLEQEALLADVYPAVKMPFLPCIDGDLLPVRADRMAAAGHGSEVDLLIGTCRDEYRLFLWGLPEGAPATPDPDVSSYFPPGTDVAGVQSTYAKAFAGRSDRDLAGAVAADALFGIPALRLAEVRAEALAQTFMYRFDWESPVLDGRLGACHGLDLPFVFDQLIAPAFHGADPPRQLADELHGAWVRFAATGDPAGGTLPTWPAYIPEQRAVMLFDAECRLAIDPAADVRRLWSGLW
jgi:para-nitrobenzyl esterase